MTSLQISTLQECGDNRLKNIGKPCAGIGVVRAFAQQKLVKLRARFAEGGLSQGCFFYSTQVTWNSPYFYRFS